jgi:hypothetical protein
MPPITIPTIDSLPEPPTKADPVNFAARADTFLGALPDFADTTNAAITEMNKIGAGLDQQTPIAAYDDETTYNFPTVAAGSDGYSYRCLGTNVLGDDPVGSATGNWVLLNGGRPGPGPLPTGVPMKGGIIGLGFTKTVEASVTVHPGVCFDETGTIRLVLAAEQVVATPTSTPWGYDLYLCVDGVVRTEAIDSMNGGASIPQAKRWIGSSFNFENPGSSLQPHKLEGDIVRFNTSSFSPGFDVSTLEIGFSSILLFTPADRIKSFYLVFDSSAAPFDISIKRGGTVFHGLNMAAATSSGKSPAVRMFTEDTIVANKTVQTYVSAIHFNR